MAGKRYPFRALADAMGLTPYAAATELGVTGKDEQDYRRRGVTWKVADRLAVKAGLDPYVVWPQMLEDAIAAVAAADEREAERRRERKRKRDREYRRRQRAKPGGLEANRLHVAAYRDQIGREAVNRAERARYWSHRDAEVERKRRARDILAPGVSQSETSESEVA